MEAVLSGWRNCNGQQQIPPFGRNDKALWISCKRLRLGFLLEDPLPHHCDALDHELEAFLAPLSAGHNFFDADEEFRIIQLLPQFPHQRMNF
jgi:hypothetical protein